MNLNWFKNKKYILLYITTFFLLFSCFSPKKNEDKYKSILKSIYQTLYLFHYNPPEINKIFSERVYKKYLETLDPKKLYFLESEINKFSLYKEKIGHEFINGDINFFNFTINHFQKKIIKIQKLIKKILSKPFNFSKEENIYLDIDNNSYAKNIKQWENQWRKYLKYLTIIEMITLKEKKKEKKYSFYELHARKKVLENINDYLEELKMKKKSDLFLIYINSITSQYDPHTSYFSPEEKKDFDFKISGQIEGVGILLQNKKNYFTIIEVIKGGPAWKSKKIEIGDKIIKVAQGKYGKSKNTIGILLSDLVKLIRGKKNTIVRLTVQKKNGYIKEITLIRNTIEQKEVFIKGFILEHKNKKKYGYIYIPEFYFNPNNKNGRNVFDDLKKEIKELNKKNIKELILDLRNNSGGSLKTAIYITGIFIGKEPIIQILNNNGKKEIINSDIKSPLWKGSLIVIVNEESASASEILSGTLQDYRRAFIIGTPTYGKGTIQTLFPLNRFTSSNEDIGTLKFTINKFYRVSGSSTQIKGIEPDLIIPKKPFYSTFTEKDQENPLKWDNIKSIPHKTWKNETEWKKIKNKVNNNIKNNYGVKILNKINQKIKIFKESKIISLQWKKFQKNEKEKKEKNKEFDFLKNYKNSISINSILVKNQLEELTKNEIKNWRKNIEKDIYLDIAIEVFKSYK